MSSSFLSSTIDFIFCKYDNNYISPSIKRFLSECIIQLINVSLLSIDQTSKSLANESKSTMKQYETISEWLENFIEPPHISMYTQTIIHIIRSLQNNIHHQHHHQQHHHSYNHSHNKHKSYNSISTNLNSQHSSMSTTDFAMSPIEEQQPKNSSKFQRLSIFANIATSNNNYLDDDDAQKSSTTNSRTSQLSEPRASNHSSLDDHHNHHNNDDILNGLNWEKYEKMSMILIRSLTSIIKKVLKRYDNAMDAIFDKQFDAIIDDVIQFLFSRLTLKFTEEFGGIIGECLGVISKKYLQKICERIHAQWEAFGDLKKQKKTSNDIKKIAILHRAVKYLEFDIYGKNRNAAIDYLTHLVFALHLLILCARI